jgi:hypothetical protein
MANRSLPVGDSEIEKSPRPGTTRVVEEDIDSADACQYFVHCCFDRSRLLEVREHEPCCPDAADRLLSAFCVTGQ